jgi:hypothetical protein
MPNYNGQRQQSTAEFGIIRPVSVWQHSAKKTSFRPLRLNLIKFCPYSAQNVDPTCEKSCLIASILSNQCKYTREFVKNRPTAAKNGVDFRHRQTFIAS